MKVREGNMWSAYEECDLFCITTNGTVFNGKLVMGGGIALEAKKKFPGIDERFGEWITQVRQPYCLSFDVLSKIAAFQVKYDVNLPADLDLISKSTDRLIEWISTQNPGYKVHLNYPGIGLGNLVEVDVLPIVSKLPDSVTVWKYARTARR